MDEQELSLRIKSFLSKKSRKFPNLEYEFSGRSIGHDFDEEDYNYEN